MFYRQVILRRSLPFAVEIPNAETEAAIDQAIEGKDLAEWADLDALKRARLMRSGSGAPPQSAYARSVNSSKSDGMGSG